MCCKAFSLIYIIVILPWCHGRPYDEEYEYTSDVDDDASHQLPANGELFEGDMIMDDRLRRAVWGQQSKKSALQEVETENLFWPNGIIYFQVDINFPDANHAMLRQAIQEFHIRTCIRFHNRTTQFDYIYFTARKDECSSSIGRTGGKQVIYLGENCRVLGTFLHESMHALGFIHEHSRPDRDFYLKVKYENIEKNEQANFHKYKLGQVDNLGALFDFNSVLLYRNNAFTKNGKETLEALANPALEFGQRVKFSIGDVKEINRLYGCRQELREPHYDGLLKEVHYKAKRRDSLRTKEIRRKQSLHLSRDLRRKIAARRDIFLRA